MFWKKSERTTKDAEEDLSRALVRQDPRTKVNTTTAQSVTTNSTVQNATKFNKNTNRVTFSTTRQTVTHTQKARITEIVSRRTPTLEELEDMVRTMNMNNKGETSGAQRRTGNFSGTNQRRSGNFASTAGGGISTKSTPKFKNSCSDTTASPVSRLIFTYDSPRNSTTTTNKNAGDITPKTPTLVKIQEISFSQKTGHSVTSQTETHQVKINTCNITSPRSTTSYTRKDARPVLALPDPTALNKPTYKNTTYTSPYRSLYTPPQPNTKSFITTTTTNSNTTYKPTYTSTFKSLYRPTFGTTTSTTTTATNTPTTKPKYTTTATTTKTPPMSTTTNFSNGKKTNLKPGCVYIFNNEHFDNPKNETRIGSSEDVKMLCKTFENFKLKVTVIENATLKKITNTVAKIETKDFSTYSSIVIVILSHGTRYEEIAAKDGNYSIDDHVLFPILRNRTLIDKPKLFFIQACKGAMESGGFQKDAALPNGTPSEILKCYSTFEGYVSYRSKEGSLFIQALCENLQLFGGIKNIKDIMETVTLLVKQQSGNRQIPTITSTLTKPYVFGDYV